MDDETEYRKWIENMSPSSEYVLFLIRWEMGVESTFSGKVERIMTWMWWETNHQKIRPSALICTRLAAYYLSIYFSPLHYSYSCSPLASLSADDSMGGEREIPREKAVPLFQIGGRWSWIPCLYVQTRNRMTRNPLTIFLNRSLCSAHLHATHVWFVLSHISWFLYTFFIQLQTVQGLIIYNLYNLHTSNSKPASQACNNITN